MQTWMARPCLSLVNLIGGRRGSDGIRCRSTEAKSSIQTAVAAQGSQHPAKPFSGRRKHGQGCRRRVRRPRSPSRPRWLSASVAPDPALAGGGNYLVARGVREGFLARLAKIQYEEKLGKLINRDEVQVERFNTNRIIRDGVLNIPDRVSAQLAAETNEKKVHEILTTEIRNALNGIADSLTNGN